MITLGEIMALARYSEARAGGVLEKDIRLNRQAGMPPADVAALRVEQIGQAFGVSGLAISDAHQGKGPLRGEQFEYVAQRPQIGLYLLDRYDVEAFEHLGDGECTVQIALWVVVRAAMPLPGKAAEGTGVSSGDKEVVLPALRTRVVECGRQHRKVGDHRVAVDR